jgi:hypothetical protein
MARKNPLKVKSKNPASMVGAMAKFVARHGHFDFIEVRGIEGDVAGYYATRLRSMYEGGLLNDRAIAALDALAFPWDGYSYRWMRMCDELEDHIAKERRLPHRLMAWWRRQRELDQEGKLEGNRAPRLRLLPFPDPTVYHWTLKFRKIDEAVRENKRVRKTDVIWAFHQYDLLQREGLVQHWNRYCRLPDGLAEDLRRLIRQLHTAHPKIRPPISNEYSEGPFR